MKVWLDGQLVEGSAARVSVTDHGLLYGDGVFEGIRVYGRKVFRLPDHLRQIFVTHSPSLANKVRNYFGAVIGAHRHAQPLRYVFGCAADHVQLPTIVDTAMMWAICLVD